MAGADIASLILRVAIGGTMLAHGWNHAFGGGRLPGTGRWFESIGLRPGRLHALMATGTELGAGFLLVLGALTPLAAAGVVGTILVAMIPNHLRNRFFLFRPAAGCEYRGGVGHRGRLGCRARGWFGCPGLGGSPPMLDQSVIGSLFPAGLPGPEHWERRYPPRALPDAAEVTRFCPSPTGYVHIGGVYVATIDVDVARHSGGTYLVRIEDTDQARVAGAPSA